MVRPFLVCFALLSASVAQNLPLPDLPYGYEALEPHIDELTMRTHHLKHHQKYADTLNGALSKLRASPQKALAKMGVDALLQNLDKIDDPKLRSAVRNGGGGYVNHDMFFKNLSPEETSPMTHDGLNAALVWAFGTIEKFKEAFSLAALEVFGSGWAWLVWDQAAAKLVIETTPNQDTPAMKPGMHPLMGLDVWEHAYYLKHQNRRVDYIAEFWQVCNWAEVAHRFDEAQAKSESAHGEL